ncbi:hypothetical protein [Niabella hibiscisoli]|uniref:hypothetical protein n=1 Tax=Niabella hibiscisoli TaxID=1825928 RepID=UPI001F10FCD9|nr:hypothetical protein [Niabella hibiscisoli]MCH5717043.1 hypothetical protein [Niabella hibiscisoli]
MSQILEDKIKQIQEKLQLLAKQNASIKKENQALKETLADARLQFNEAADVAEALQHQLDAKKYSQAMMDPEEKKAFEKRSTDILKKLINVLRC